MRDIAEFLILLLFLCIAVMGPVILAASYFESKSCESYQEVTERKTEWRFFGGCFVDHGDRMIPKDEYKFIELRGEPQ